MKRALLAVVGVVLTGGIIGMSYLNTNDEKETVKTSTERTEIASDTTESKEAAVTLPAPTERTVDVQGGYPWQYFGAKDIIAGQKNGEVYFLFSDAEAFENMLKDFALSDESASVPMTKADNGASFAEYLRGFIEGTQEYYPDKKDYFMKMSEVENALKTGDFESIPAKVEQAKALRNM
jgi:hypothetical protein